MAQIMGRQRPLRSPTQDEIRRAVEEALAEYDWTPWEEVLRPQVQQYLEEGFRRGARNTWEALRQVGVGFRWELVHARARDWAAAHAARLVGRRVLPDGRIEEALDPRMRIDLSTRVRIEQDLTRWIGEGKGWREIAKLIEERQYTGFFPDWRARRIARTEAAFADNAGNLAGYRWAGITHVRVFDGVMDEICAAANGQIWTIEYAEEHLLGHPHCSRQFAAVMPDELEREMLGQQAAAAAEDELTPDEIDRFWEDWEYRYEQMRRIIDGRTPEERERAVRKVDRFVTEWLDRNGFTRGPVNSVTVEGLSPGTAGLKTWTCHLKIDANHVARGVMAHSRGYIDDAIKTWFHESIHARGYAAKDIRHLEYQSWPGYEEGLTESLANYLAKRAGLSTTYVAYRYYVTAYEKLAEALGVDLRDMLARLWTAPNGAVRDALHQFVEEWIDRNVESYNERYEMKRRFRETADRLFHRDYIGARPNVEAIEQAWGAVLGRPRRRRRSQ